MLVRDVGGPEQKIEPAFHVAPCRAQPLSLASG
jgi:hypothetical protein